jgi:sterol desaturase/sphingolipid hydroxylase (fatty acid hydroxylase superfamily)
MMDWIHMVISIYSPQYLCEHHFILIYILINSRCSFLLFTDYCIYWIHRWLHLPMFYKYIHKPHHKWISTSLSFRQMLSINEEIYSPNAFLILCISPSRRILAIVAIPPLHLSVSPS